MKRTANRTQRRARRRGPVLTITLTQELSHQWEAASERAGIPLEWMLHDSLMGEVDAYMDDSSGYRQDSREAWWHQRHRRIPIRVLKGGAV